MKNNKGKVPQKRKPLIPKRKPMSAPLAEDRFRNVRSVNITGNNDELVLEFEEVAMLCTTRASTSPAQSITIRPGASGMARLDQFGLLYDQFRFEKMELIYRSQVGANTNGLAVIAVDYNTNDVPQNFSATQALIPRMVDKVWADMSMSVSPERLMKSKWHFTAINTTPSGFGPVCNINFHSTGPNDTLVGSLWMKYRVRFSGPTSAVIAPSLPSSGAGAAYLGAYVEAAVVGTTPTTPGTATLSSVIPATGATINNAGIVSGASTLAVVFTPGTNTTTSWSPYSLVDATFDITTLVSTNLTTDSTVTYSQNTSTSGNALYNPFGGEPLINVIQSKAQLISGAIWQVVHTIHIVDYWINMYGNAAFSLTLASAAVASSAVAIVGKYRQSATLMPAAPGLTFLEAGRLWYKPKILNLSVESEHESPLSEALAELHFPV